MKRRRSIEDFEALQSRIMTNHEAAVPTIVIPAGTCCQASGANDLIRVAKRELLGKKLTDTVRLRITGCQGFCQMEPSVLVEPRGTFYPKVGMKTMSRIVECVARDEVLADELFITPDKGEQIERQEDIPFFKNQVRTILGRNEKIDPLFIYDYINNHGYSTLAKVFKMADPEWVINEVKVAGLRGRGGAGFPTGLKWEFLANQANGHGKFLVCNADEGDPGAYMDRSVLEGNPHGVIEGMIIGAYATGATGGVIYVRNEYPLAIKHLIIALRQARELGVLGENILGTGFSFDINLVKGAGAFVCGEETALIRSIEGKMGEPRQRPPFPVQKGIEGKPTAINNVETWSNIPIIIEKGANEFAKIGTENNSGTKIFSLVGKVKYTGLVEVPMGTTIRSIVDEIGGGPIDNARIKAIQTGGPSGGCIPADLFDIKVDYDSLSKAGSIMGSGGMIVMDNTTCMVDIAKYFMNFLKDESCGKCFTCRKGTQRMHEILDDISQGNATNENLELLEELAQVVKDTTMCGLGQTASNPVLSTLRHFREEYLAHIRDKYCPAEVCKKLVPAHCQKACPAGIDVPSYVALIAHGRFEEALRVIRQDNPFPWVCGLVCPAPCETECQRGTVDKPISIRALKAFASKYAMENLGGYTTAIKKKQDEKIAIIGSGPAGLSAAYYLAIEGYKITVFEALPKAGGMLRVGIPPHRLPKDLLDKEIESISKLGIEIKTNTPLGPDLTIQNLFDQGFKAIYLSIGAHKPIPLGIRGEDADGMMQGVSYLRKLNLGEPVPRGKKVVVIGGGNVAIDVARSAIRKGANEVTILYRRTRNEMLAYESEIEEALEEGVNITYLSAPVEIRIKDNKVAGLQCIKMALGEPDASGRRRPIPIQGSEFEVEADLVFPAVGQVPDTTPFKEIEGLEFNERRRTIRVDPETFATNLEGVFAGGDSVLGSATVIEAISNGKKAALFIDAFIRGAERPRRPPVPVRRMHVPVLEISEEKMEQLKRPEMPLLAIGRRKTTFEQLELGFTEKVARDEAQRCLRCDLS